MQFALAEGAGYLKKPIRQRAFAVVDMGDDTKITYVFSVVGHSFTAGHTHRQVKCSAA
jgi:hypothetical protein